MRLRILGCSGGIGGELRTTSMLLDDDVLIDAGTGVGNLSLQELARIDHIFLTHSHMDHVACIPFLLDTVGFQRERPVTIHAIRETLDILSAHLFNWKLWPDFRKIPDEKQPILRYAPVLVGEPVSLSGGRTITPLPANHVVPAVGYRLDSGAASLVFTGDTTSQDELWTFINKINNLKYLIIESALSDAERELAVISKHLCPSLLAGELAKLRLDPAIYVTHFKPREADLIMAQIEGLVPQRGARMLEQDQVFEF
ncbi:MAG: 3',5'-cyclic-nucleotide phosphodiesterase [Burkholderiales bacterium]